VNEGERKKAEVSLFLAAVLWSTGGILIKWVEWHPLAIAGGRSAIAALVLLFAVRRFHLSFSGIKVAGAVAYTLTVALFVAANKLTTAANAILLQYTAPIHIALFGAWFLGERTSLVDWISIAAVMLGMVLFFFDSLTTAGMIGNVLAVMSGLSFAWLALLLRKQKDGSPIESILLGNILTALIGAPFFFESMPSATSVVGLLLLGIFQLGIPYVLYGQAVKHVTALEATLIPALEPILNPIWVLLLMGEKPGAWALIGGVIVLLAITVRSVLRLRGEKKLVVSTSARVGART
jgi:drug/metabolite transporter (DMT)-like permease